MIGASVSPSGPPSCFLETAVDDDAGGNGVHPYVAVGVRGGHITRECHDTGLAGAVGGEGAAAVGCGDGSGVDDRAAAAFEHGRDGEATAEHDAVEVDTHRSAPRIERHGDDVLVGEVELDHGRVVVEEVQSAVRSDGVGDHALDCVGIGDVGDLDPGAAPVACGSTRQSRRRPPRRCRRWSLQHLQLRGGGRWHVRFRSLRPSRLRSCPGSSACLKCRAGCRPMSYTQSVLRRRAGSPPPQLSGRDGTSAQGAEITYPSDMPEHADPPSAPTRDKAESLCFGSNPDDVEGRRRTIGGARLVRHEPALAAPPDRKSSGMSSGRSC